MERRSSRRRARRRRRRVWLLAVAGVCLIGFLYYRPVKAYVETGRVLAARRAEVRSLAREKSALERRLSLSGSGETLLQEARRLGLVQPGEHLFIIRGIRDWLRTHRHSLPH